MCLVCGVSDDAYFSGCAVLFFIELEGYSWLYDGFLPRLFYEPIRGMVLVLMRQYCIRKPMHLSGHMHH